MVFAIQRTSISILVKMSEKPYILCLMLFTFMYEPNVCQGGGGSPVRYEKNRLNGIQGFEKIRGQNNL